MYFKSKTNYIKKILKNFTICFLSFQHREDDPETTTDPQFDLGNGATARSPDEAMQRFLEREFPEVLNILKGESHELIFIPESFIYGNLTEKVSSHNIIIEN